MTTVAVVSHIGAHGLVLVGIARVQVVELGMESQLAQDADLTGLCRFATFLVAAGAIGAL